MRLSKEALQDFEAILKKKYPGRVFTDQEILDMATRVMRAVELIYRPLPKYSKETISDA
jgi:hypothetical protein